MKRLLLLVLSVGLYLPVHASTLTIEITQGLEGALPIAVVPFAWRGDASTPPAHEVGGVVSADLQRSGRFKPLPTSQMLARPTRGEEVDFRDWRALNVENLVVGEVTPNGPGGYLVKFYLYDVFRGEQVTGYSLPTTVRDLRATAHHIADIIYETLTGQPGAFATRIAYVTSERSGKDKKETVELRIADADGYGPQTIVSSSEPIMSPAWSPDGRQ
ncbi:MAG: Tol-Pal system protein TolB, partial [Gammaproteobacteria bacterium]|nr:Tol-Pal system protein TolB [Gammaproteobacteria bacterium]